MERLHGRMSAYLFVCLFRSSMCTLKRECEAVSYKPAFSSFLCAFLPHNQQRTVVLLKEKKKKRDTQEKTRKQCRRVSRFEPSTQEKKKKRKKREGCKVRDASTSPSCVFFVFRSSPLTLSALTRDVVALVNKPHQKGSVCLTRKGQYPR
jgi:hypothetical protein